LGLQQEVFDFFDLFCDGKTDQTISTTRLNGMNNLTAVFSFIIYLDDELTSPSQVAS
jgi:hypothetical protein